MVEPIIIPYSYSTKGENIMHIEILVLSELSHFILFAIILLFILDIEILSD